MRPACLTRLRIAGFKTFAKPVTLDILPGLTGLVGPNSCGESNVVDALRWAIDEGKHAVDALTLGIRQHAKPVDRGDGWPLVVRTVDKFIGRVDLKSTNDRLPSTATRHVPLPTRARGTWLD